MMAAGPVSYLMGAFCFLTYVGHGWLPQERAMLSGITWTHRGHSLGFLTSYSPGYAGPRSACLSQPLHFRTSLKMSSSGADLVGTAFFTCLTSVVFQAPVL